MHILAAEKSKQIYLNLTSTVWIPSTLRSRVQAKPHAEKTGLIIQFRFGSQAAKHLTENESKSTQLLQYFHPKFRTPKQYIFPQIWIASLLISFPNSHPVCLWPEVCLPTIDSHVCRAASSLCIRCNLDPKLLPKTWSQSPFGRRGWPGEDRLP